MSDTDHSVFSLKGVSCAYGKTDVLSNVDLEIHAGSFTGIIGRNGAGKTTLFRLFTGAHRARLGEVRCSGRGIREIPPRERARQCAVVPQTEDMVFPFSVRAMVLLGRAPHVGFMGYETDDDLAAAQRAMENAGVLDFADRLVTDLSGGELHRVLIARALAQEAPILLLDEPNAHLDLHFQVELFELLSRLHADGRTILCITHDLNLAARYCERLLLLDDGRLVADGAPVEVLTPERIQRHFSVTVAVNIEDSIPHIRLLRSK